MKARGWALGRVVIAVACLVVVAGCGSSSDDSKKSGGAAKGAGSLTPPSKPVTLTVWAWNTTTSGYEKGESAIDKAFQKKYPNIKVDRKVFPYATYSTKLRTALAANNGPDVAWTDGSPALNPYLRPTASLLTPEQKRNITLVDQSMAKDPGLHNLPWTLYGYFWAYNKSLFKKAGLDPEKAPATFDDIVNACGKLSAAGIQPIAGGFKDGFQADWYVFFGLTSQLTSPTEIQGLNKNFNFQDPKVKLGVEYWLKLVKAGCFGKNFASATLQSSEDQFRAKKAAMTYTCCRLPSSYRPDVGQDVGAFPMPPTPDSVYGKPVLDIGPSLFFALSRKSNNCRAAWAYVSFYLGPDGQRLIWETTKIPPNYKGVTLTSKDPLDQEFLKWLQISGNHTGAAPALPDPAATIDRLWPEVASGRMSVDDALSKAQAAQKQAVQRAPAASTDQGSAAGPCN